MFPAEEGVMTLGSRLIPLLSLSLAAFACAPSEDDFANAIVTSALQAPEAQSITDDLTGDPCATLTAESAARQAADRPSVLLEPERCLEKRAEGAELHVDFDGCRGPFGGMRLDGGVDAFFAVTGECRLMARVSDRDLRANDRPLDYGATAEIVVTDGAHEIDWRASFSGTTRRGRAIEQRSDLGIVLDRQTSCRTVEGETQGHVDGFEYDWGVTGMAVCPGECPSSGFVKAAWHGRRGERNFSVEFDGSSIARVTMPSGRTRNVGMICDAAEVVDDG
jgi:hypothetical protein